MKKLSKNRDSFNTKWGFILACIGSAVGMGNIWRFPVLVSQFGGLTFLIPYIIFVILIGSTGVIEEFALGRRAGTGPVGAFGLCASMRKERKKGEVIGAIPILGSLALAIGYTVVLGWIIKYTYLAISGDLYALGSNMGDIVSTFESTAPETNTLTEAISMMFKNGIFGIGNGGWQGIGLFFALVIMAMGIAGGIEKVNKILMPTLFFLFIILGIYIFNIPGSHDGYKYIFTLKLEGLINPRVWVYAFGQAFFSLSVAGNGSVIYGSYLSKKEDIPSSAFNVALFDTIASLLAAFVIIPAMATTGTELSSGGPGLMFIYLVNVINAMPGGRIISIIFFVAVLFAGISSIINMYEAPVEYLQEKFKYDRLKSVVIIGVIGMAVSVLIQPWTSKWMDIVSIYICPLGAFLAAVMFFWVANKKFAIDSVNLGAKKKIGPWFYPLGKYVYCIAAASALILGAMLGGIG